MLKVMNFCFLLILALLSLTHCQTNPDYTFEDYVIQYKLNFTEEEFGFRKKIFYQRFNEILEWNAKNEGKYRKAVNNFTCWTQEEIKKYQTYKPGLKKVPVSHKPLRVAAVAQNAVSSIDYRERGIVTSVKSQGSCGSCWAFSSAAAYQSMLLLHEQKYTDLSEQYVLDCSGAGTCDGGIPYDAFESIKTKGIPLETEVPYKARDISRSCSSYSFTKLTNQVRKINHYEDLTHDELKQMLLDNGPLAVAIQASDLSFNEYSSGVYNGCQGKNIDHAVLLVGVTTQGDWIIKNSWGTDWGMDGFGIIDKDNDCGILSYVDLIDIVHGQSTDFGEETNSNTDGNTDGNSDGNADGNADESSSVIQYTIRMTDTYGDGWGGIEFGFKQNDIIVATFGSQFTSGSIYGDIKVTIPSNIETEVVVVVMGDWTYEIGFTIKNNKGELVYEKTPDYFSSSVIFVTLCQDCTKIQTKKPIFVFMEDSYGDGWNGNQLALKNTQTGQYLAFGAKFTEGHSYDPAIKFQVPKGVRILVVPYVLGEWRAEIKFKIRDNFGFTLLNYEGGSNYYATSLLGQFCIGCSNQLQVKQLQSSNEKKLSSSLTTQSPQQTTTNTIVKQKQISPKLITAVIVLSIIVGILLILLIGLGYLLSKVKASSNSQPIEEMTLNVRDQNDTKCNTQNQLHIKH